MNKIIYSIIVLSTILLASCNSNDDVDSGLKDSGITITDDVDCCSAEEALQVYNFLKTKKISVVMIIKTIPNIRYLFLFFTSLPLSKC